MIPCGTIDNVQKYLQANVEIKDVKWHGSKYKMHMPSLEYGLDCFRKDAIGNMVTVEMFVLDKLNRHYWWWIVIALESSFAICQ